MMGIEEQKGQAFDAINQNATIGPKRRRCPKTLQKDGGGALKDFLINYCEFMRIISSWIAAAMAMTKPERAAGEGNGAGKPPRILTL